MRVWIDGEVMEIKKVDNYGYLPMVEVYDGRADYYVAPSTEDAGEAAREYWSGMAENDPQEFRCLVGDETLVNWALGEYAGPGSTQVRSLQAWLDLWLDTPEEQWASYDGYEREYRVTEGVRQRIMEEFGVEIAVKGVAYRHN